MYIGFCRQHFDSWICCCHRRRQGKWGKKSQADSSDLSLPWWFQGQKKQKNAILLFSLQPEWWYEEFQNGLKTPLNKSWSSGCCWLKSRPGWLRHHSNTHVPHLQTTMMKHPSVRQHETKKPQNWNPENHLNQTSIVGFHVFFFPRCSCWTVLLFKPTKSPSNQLFAIAMFGISCWRFQFLRYQQLGIAKNYMCFFSSPRFWGRYLMNQKNVSSVLARDRNNSCRISWKLRVFFVGPPLSFRPSRNASWRPKVLSCWAMHSKWAFFFAKNLGDGFK